MRAIDGDALIDKYGDWYTEEGAEEGYIGTIKGVVDSIPTIVPEPCRDADKLKRCRFEYINACKITTHPTPDTSKNDIYDAYAIIKALHPIFGDEDF